MLPKPLETCRCTVPPVNTGNWNDFSWRNWYAGTCMCYGHQMLRKIKGLRKYGLLG